MKKFLLKIRHEFNNYYCICIETIPENVQYLFQSFQRCMAPKIKTRKFGDPEARQIAKVILFIAEEIKKNQKVDDKNEEA